MSDAELNESDAFSFSNPQLGRRTLINRVTLSAQTGLEFCCPSFSRACIYLFRALTEQRSFNPKPRIRHQLIFKVHDHFRY